MRYAGRTAERNSRWTGALLSLPLALTIAAVLLWPIAAMAARVLTAEGAHAWAAVLLAGRYRTALIHSLGLSAATALGAVALAILPAWTLARDRFPGRNILRAAISLPLSFSGVLFGFLMIVLLGQAGFVPHLADLLFGRPLLAGSAYTLAGLYAAYLYFEVPRAVLTLEASFRRFPQELDWAARTLGAGSWTRVRRVILPVATPGLRAALATTFATSMGSFGVALMLSRRFSVAPLEAYTQITGFLDDATAAALCLALAALTLSFDAILSP